MDFLFIDSRDPIFGLIVLVVSLLVIITFSYFWGIVAKKNKAENIDKFLQKFSKDDDKIMSLLSSLEPSELSKIASALGVLGDWQNAVLFYEKAIKNTNEPSLQASLLLALGGAYIKTGFLERAKASYTELLSTSPRQKEALFNLIFINEKLRDFKSAFECLESLEVIEGKNDELRAYLLALKLISQPKSAELKLKELKNLPQTALIRRFELELALDNFLEIDKNNLPPLKLAIDLLGERSFEFYEAEKNSQDEQDFFLLKILELAKKSEIPAKLDFSYVCSHCKQEYPLFFARCPKCLQIASISPKASIKGDISKEAQ